MEHKKLKLHEGRFDGQSALVVAPGPSAKNWREIYEQSKPDIVCSVKQGIRLTKDRTDVHFFNHLEVENWGKYIKDEQLTSIYTDSNPPKKQYNNYDLKFIVDNKNRNPYEHCIALNRNYDRYTIRHSGIYRPWGPTIMLETVIYYLEYTNVKKITTIGWDAPFMEKEEDYEYFYKKSKTDKDKSQTKRIKDLDLHNFFRHIAGLKYYVNEKPYKTEAFCEITVVQKMMPSLRSWLLKKSIELECYTKKRGKVYKVL